MADETPGGMGGAHDAAGGAPRPIRDGRPATQHRDPIPADRDRPDATAPADAAPELLDLASLADAS